MHLMSYALNDISRDERRMKWHQIHSKNILKDKPTNDFDKIFQTQCSKLIRMKEHWNKLIKNADRWIMTKRNSSYLGVIWVTVVKQCVTEIVAEWLVVTRIEVKSFLLAKTRTTKSCLQIKSTHFTLIHKMQAYKSHSNCYCKMIFKLLFINCMAYVYLAVSPPRNLRNWSDKLQQGRTVISLLPLIEIFTKL